MHVLRHSNDRLSAATSQYNMTNYHGFITCDSTTIKALNNAQQCAKHGSEVAWFEGERGVGKTMLAHALAADHAIENVRMPYRIYSCHINQYPHITNEDQALLVNVPADITHADIIQFQHYLATKLHQRTRPIHLLCFMALPSHHYSANAAHHLNAMRQLFTEHDYETIKLTSLHERPADIATYWHHFIDKFCPDNSVSKHTLLDAPLATLPDVSADHLADNVRSLKRLCFEWCEQRCSDNRNDIIHSHQPRQHDIHHNMTVTLTDNSGNLRPMDELEADIIHRACSHCNGSKSMAAKQLKLGRTTIYRKLKKE